MRRSQPVTDEAFAELYRRWWPLVFGVCFRWSRDRHRAEEFAQETFMRVWRSPPALDGDEQWIAWLRVVASRVCVDAYRKRGAVQYVDLVALEEESGIGMGNDVALHETRVANSSVTDALDALPADQRVAFDLHLEGWSQRRVAVHLGTTPGRVEALVVQARRRLRHSLGGEVA